MRKNKKKCFLYLVQTFGKRSASEADTAQVHCVSDVIGAQFEPDFLGITNCVNARFFGRNCKIILNNYVKYFPALIMEQ